MPKDRIEIVHAAEEVLMDDEPIYALRNKKQSSMRFKVYTKKNG